MLQVGSTMPTAVYIGPEELLFGDAALERGDDAPDRLHRDFVRDVGKLDAVISADGEQFVPADLYAWVVDDVAKQVTEDRGAAPAGVWVVVPASWSDARIDAITEALDRDEQVAVDIVTVPEALAARYWQIDPADSDLTVLVCDVDQRSLEASIVRVLPGGGSRLIGAAVAASVALGAAGDPALDERAIESIVQRMDDAGIDDDDIDAILLSGASTRLGDFERLLIDRFGEPLDSDPIPGSAAALGAAFLLAREVITDAAAVAEAAASAPRTTAPSSRPAAAAAWYRRPVGVIALSLGGVLVAGSLALASAFAPGGLANSGENRNTVERSSNLTNPGGRATSGPSPSVAASPSAIPQPAPSSSAPAETDSAQPQQPRVRVNARVPRSAAPVPVAPNDPVATPPPASTPDPAPETPAPSEPSPTPSATAEPDPTPDPIPVPTPALDPIPVPTPPIVVPPIEP